MKSAPITAALTLGLTGRYERQGTEAARAVRLWADACGVRLMLVDDQSSREAAVAAYRGWIDSADLLIGPYASGLVRAVAPLIRNAGRVLWNHGGSADDLAQPGIASLSAPASSYFDGIVDEAADREVRRLVIVHAAGPFARAVADGARARAALHGIDSHTIDASTVHAEDLTEAGLLTAGPFEHDIAVVRGLCHRDQRPALLAAVAAGISDFPRELMEAAEGVLAPVQWWPKADLPDFGPSGTEFASRYQRRTGQQPSYPAAQAAAAGYLAHGAYDHRLGVKDLPGWRTSTLLGNFALDDHWRQVGHSVTTVRWHHGRMVRLHDQAP